MSPAKRSERKPSPTKRRKAQPRDPAPTKFVPVERAFKAQIKVVANRDINGPVAPGIKFHIGQGRIGFLDEDTARVWQAKGYVTILDGTVEPVSADELAELTSNDSTISL